MVILSNCLTPIVDEGCRKVAHSLIRRLKQADPASTVVSYESKSDLSDIHICVNKWMLSRKLAALLHKKNEELLYVPSPAKMLPLAVRVWILSLFAHKGVKVLVSMQFPVGTAAKWLFKLSRAQVIAIANDAYAYYNNVLGENTRRLKVGVDADKFAPAPEQRQALRRKYGIPEEKTVVLHVGHLRPERNIEKLLDLDEKFHGVLVVSTQTADERDAELRRQLLEKKNITVLEEYLPDIEEIYQLSDVYLFPVVDKHACIASPLSVLEAAACDLPVVMTPFGELKELLNQDGFYEIDDFAQERLNALLQKAYEEKKSTRSSVLEYDWNMAVHKLLSEI